MWNTDDLSIILLKIKVIWEQNHVSGDSFSFLCQWLTVFPKCKRTWSTPDLFCDLLLKTPSFSWVLLSPLPEHGRQHLRALGTKSTCCVNLFGRKDKVGEERRRKEARRDCALISQRKKSFMQNGAFYLFMFRCKILCFSSSEARVTSVWSEYSICSTVSPVKVEAVN